MLCFIGGWDKNWIVKNIDVEPIEIRRNKMPKMKQLEGIYNKPTKINPIKIPS